MTAGEQGTPESRGTRFLRQTRAGITRLSGAAYRSINVKIAVRLFKYVVLIAGVSVTLMVVFDAYSYYVARRDIDAELRSKKEKAVFSLEYLGVLSQRQRALAITRSRDAAWSELS